MHRRPFEGRHLILSFESIFFKGDNCHQMVAAKLWKLFFLGTLFSRKLYLKNFNIENKDNKISRKRKFPQERSEGLGRAQLLRPSTLETSPVPLNSHPAFCCLYFLLCNKDFRKAASSPPFILSPQYNMTHTLHCQSYHLYDEVNP